MIALCILNLVCKEMIYVHIIQVSSATLLTDSKCKRLLLVGGEITVFSFGSTMSETWMLEESLQRLKTIKAVEHAR